MNNRYMQIGRILLNHREIKLAIKWARCTNTQEYSTILSYVIGKGWL